jgi:ABC-type dipeptide/oligopeptide/nickel transport system permease component
VARYAVLRLVRLIPQVLLVVTLLFVLFRLLPGDPAQLIAGLTASSADVARIRHQLGLDRPIWVQYGVFLAQAAQGNLGRSISYGLPVTAVVAAHLPPTLELMVSSILLTVIVGIPAGVLSAVRPRGPLGYASTLISVVFLAVPNFWLGLLLVEWLSVRDHLLPAVGWSGPASLVLPTLAIAARLVALVARMTRSSMLDVSFEDYVRTARAKGLSAARVLFRHMLKPTLPPVITVLGLQAGYLLGGALVIEVLFAIPGVGQLMVTGVATRDYPLVQGITLFYVAAFMLINVLVDLSYGWLDPRVRYT